MATSQIAYAAEKAIGHDDSAITQQDVAVPSGETGKSGATMKALCWMGKNKVEILDVPQPKVLEPKDVILKVTGSTVCGSDLHLLHGVVPEMAKHDVLGHEFCGIAHEVPDPPYPEPASENNLGHSLTCSPFPARLRGQKGPEGQALRCVLPVRLWRLFLLQE